MSKQARGFTLIELVVGIVVLAIAMVGLSTMLISQTKDALEPLYRLRASQLGQGILQNILARAYDQNSDHNGGYYRCNEIWGDTNLWFNGTSWQTGSTPTPIACSAGNGIDTGEVAEDHFNFNDVDDFITTGFIGAVTYGDLLGDDLDTQYNNYAVKIAVTPYTATPTDPTMKRIDVTIKTPSDEQILFSALKGNY